VVLGAVAAEAPAVEQQGCSSPGFEAADFGNDDEVIAAFHLTHDATVNPGVRPGNLWMPLRGGPPVDRGEFVVLFAR
jgi:hypothetical protein